MNLLYMCSFFHKNMSFYYNYLNILHGNDTTLFTINIFTYSSFKKILQINCDTKNIGFHINDDLSACMPR